MKSKTNRHNRDGGRFLALPHVVMESEAFKSLTGQQIKLLLDIAMQLTVGNFNNGQLSASWRYLSEERGWTSKNTIRRALTALEDRGLIFCTRKGRLPKVAAWYAITWAPLHHQTGMDVGPQSLPRGEYARWAPKNRAPCPKSVLMSLPIGPKSVLTA
ncbi:MAG: hypothetical protein EPN31_12150 [Castellaniella sp.]|uniref:hypothetical protein n=1 Tax=Castellaniella sp. TaxID=1955812 RepID=UPI0012080EF9|nr:hypothetical protein [Castellaniella sp.]TAN27279.1 MAG: hypothetical protein EPN31_12150 [Castellaniella sp.]